MNEQIGARLGAAAPESGGMKRPVAYVAGTGARYPGEGDDEPRLRGARHRDVARVDRRAHRDRRAPHRRRRTRPPARMAADGGAQAMERAGVHAGRARRDRPQHRDARPPAARRPRSTCRRSSAPRARPRSTSRAACSGWLYGADRRRRLIAVGRRRDGARRRRREDERDRRLEGSRRPACCSATARARWCCKRAKQRARASSRTFMRSDGTLAELLYRPAGGATMPFIDSGARRSARTS